MKFKVGIAVILVFFAVSGIKAQTTAGLMEDFIANIRKAPAIETEFVWNGSVSGTMILQGDMFYIHMDEFYVCIVTVKYKILLQRRRRINGKNFHTTGIPLTYWKIHPHSSAGWMKIFISLKHLCGKKHPEDPVWEITLVPHSVNSPFAFVVISLKAEDLTPVYTVMHCRTDPSIPVVLTSFSAVPARSARFFAPDTSGDSC